MKKILFFVAVVIAVVCSSCSEQHKAKTSIQKYLGNDTQILECVYTENDTILTYEYGLELVEKANNINDEGRKYRRMANLHYANRNYVMGDMYDRMAMESLDTSHEMILSAYKIEPKQHIKNTATVTYKDKNGNDTTQIFIVSDSYNITGTSDCIGVSKKDLFDAIHKYMDKEPLD